MTDSRFYKDLGPLTLGQLMAGLSVSMPDDAASKVIKKVENLAGSGPDSLSFLASGKHKSNLSNAKAAACLLPEKLAPLAKENGIVPIVSASPRGHFARIVSRLVAKRPIDEPGESQIGKTAKIHAAALIGAGAIIGEGVEIGPYVVIGPGVEIGAGSIIESQVTIECALIGENCLIKSGARIGTEGFGIDGDDTGIVNLPHIGRAILGDHVRVGSNSCIDRGFLGDTVIGDHVKIDNQVQIAHNCTIGEGTMIAAHTGISGSCHVGKNVKMGGAVGLADHITVGDGAQLAAAAGVMHDVPAGEIWSGVPALPIRDHMRLIAATRKLIAKKPGKS